MQCVVNFWNSSLQEVVEAGSRARFTKGLGAFGDDRYINYYWRACVCRALTEGEEELSCSREGL